MKKFFLSAISFLLAVSLFAQAAKKSDVVLKTNGDELSGKVTEVGDSSVKFIYTGETLSYTIRKSDILKIKFASGRVESYSKPVVAASVPAETKADAPVIKNEATAIKRDPSETRNKIAVLPFGYITDNQDAGTEVGYRVQNECYSFLNGHSGQYTLLDPRTTNTLLIRAGATPDKLRSYTMDELCNILGVEYIIDATINQNKTSLTSTQSDNYNATTKETNNKTGKQNTNISGSSSSSTMQNYETMLTLNIYTDKNANIYSQNRKSFWSNGDAYRASLQYVLKRCPFYQK